MNNKRKALLNQLIGIVIGTGLLILTSNCNKNNPGTVTDIDGNVYHIVTIGKQIWMVENLKVTRYRNGDLIPNVADTRQWNFLQTGAYCNYDNSSQNAIIYGHLYNWYTATDIRNIAPKGWHVPSFAELETLMTYLGGNTEAGGKMKETGTTHWLGPNTGATNGIGFTALPGGYRLNHGDGSTFHTLGSNGYWWTTTQSYEIYAWNQCLYWNFANVERDLDYRTYGFSVRCVKD